METVGGGLERVLSFDEIVDAIGSIHRRELLVALAESDSREAGWMYADEHPNGVHPTDHRLLMEHIHLPKLEQYGLIAWNREDSSVRQGPTFTQVNSLLTTLTDNQSDLPADWMTYE